MTAEEVVVDCSIREEGTKRVVLPGHIPEIKTSAGVTSQKARIVASVFPATFMVAAAQEKNGRAEVRIPTETILDVGVYIVEVRALMSEQATTGTAKLVVGSSLGACYWDTN